MAQLGSLTTIKSLSIACAVKSQTHIIVRYHWSALSIIEMSHYTAGHSDWDSSHQQFANSLENKRIKYLNSLQTLASLGL